MNRFQAYKITGIISIASTLFSVILFGYITNWFRGSLTPSELYAPPVFLTALSLLIIVSGISLIVTFIDFMMSIFITSPFHTQKLGFGHQVLDSLLFIAYVLFFPLFLAVAILKGTKVFSIKAFQLCAVFLFLLPLWILGYYVSGYGAYQIVRNQLGLYEDTIPLAGTGSMYPTFPKVEGKTPLELALETAATAGMQPYPQGIDLFGKRYFGYTIGHGDIVNFANEKTFELSRIDSGIASGFLKRVIGLPGDRIELRDGIVYRNDEALYEQYTAKARSTFGGEFVPDCRKIIVPNGKLFVMGDNRKGSLDSRFALEYVAYGDVNHVIPYIKQTGILDKNWRDTTHDLENSSKIKLNKDEYLSLLNKKRAEENLPAFRYSKKLENSATKRGTEILVKSELSPTSKLNGDAMEKAINDEGYIHYTKGELPVQGHYEAEELFENQFEFPGSKSFLLRDNFLEIGIAEVEEEINGCPTQIIVQHLAGYVPPNYDKETIDSWKNALEKLKELKPGWDNLKTQTQFYSENKTDIDRITFSISYRITNIEKLVVKMNKNEWLSDEENRFMEEYDSLAREHTEIAQRLNSKLQ